MAGYLGSVPVPQATQHRESFTATEGQTSFATAGYTPQFVDVYLNGSHLSPADFTASNGSDVVLGVAASADDVCDIISYTPFEVADQTFTGTTTMDVVAIGGATQVDGAITSNGLLTVDGTANSSQAIFTGTSGRGLEISTFSVGAADEGVKLDATASGSTGEIALATNGSIKATVKGSGELLVGKTVATLATNGSALSSGALTLTTGSTSTNQGTANGASLLLVNPTATDNNFSHIGGYNSNSLVTSQINLVNKSHSGRLGVITFGTHDGSALTERMRIHNSMVVTIGKSADNATDPGVGFSTGGSSFVRASAAVVAFNRTGNDGAIINLNQAGTTEGTISVSGTTVSYNGGHLARWSQLTDGSKDTNIVKGTVMTNLNAMAVWSHDAAEAQDAVSDRAGNLVSRASDAVEAHTEDNEQLNCMAVSSTEGDANVAGVFVNWDDDDDFNDMNIAMTGDMVIRIARGTTVARGDLLMSAGDGTAKPQGEDIVRSKTIAKVTSTYVSNTYDDGTYCVPCVLMAC